LRSPTDNCPPKEKTPAGEPGFWGVDDRAGGNAMTCGLERSERRYGNPKRSVRPERGRQRKPTAIGLPGVVELLILQPHLEVNVWR
jgi:hypothetical protein